MHWKMVNKLPTMVCLPQLPISSSGRPASMKTTRDVSRAGERFRKKTCSMHLPHFLGEVMESNSIETLLLRHYGNAASVPAGLEEKLRASVHYKDEESRKAQLAAARLQHKRVNRRPDIILVARGVSKKGAGSFNTGPD